ncbi:MAG: hypothetical protein L6246_09465 [Thermodesulfovibrionales bacterium]|nr:hypothetical protein [Thermodesulfovibrionales bacterium]
MSKMVSKQRNSIRELLKQFMEIDTSDFPVFYSYNTPLEKSLWVLSVAKEKLGIKRLSAEEIALIIRDIKEISIDERAITNSLNRAGDKIHTYQEDRKVYYKIMKPGKDYIISQIKEGAIEVLYFEPDKHYTSKKLLSKNILGNLTGELRIVDPYCGERTLDILSNLKNRDIKFLTRVENLRDKERERFLRELKDFKSEHTKIEFKSYPHPDIHDRYIISSDRLVVLGHSIKDLGTKESFAIVLNKDSSKNIVEALIENFNRRWRQSAIL